MIRKAFLGALAASLLSSTAMADEGPTLTIKNFIGTIEWSQGESLAAEIQRDGDTLDVTRSQSGLMIDGGIGEVDTTNCKGYSGKYSFSWSWGKDDNKPDSQGRWGGFKDLDQYPKLSITVPSDTHIVIEEAIPFIMGQPNIASLDGNVKGCGDVEIGDASEYINFNSRGSGDLTAGNTPDAKIKVSGSGDVDLGDVGALTMRLSGSGDGDINSAREVDISVSGSGDVEIDEVLGNLKIESRGSGELEVGNVAGNVQADSRGSGNMEFDDIGGNLTYDGRGSGEFSARSANGLISIDVRGSGDVDIEDGEASDLSISASGSSDVGFGGTAKTATLKASGSSDIDVYRVTDQYSERDTGSADITVRKTK